MELKLWDEIDTIVSGLLLIVPYGIETYFQFSCIDVVMLLIVPYGIETQFRLGRTHKHKAFNRTLWN